MLRLDSSEMLPGSQKGEKTAEIRKTHTLDSAILAPRKSSQLVGMGNDHVTAARCKQKHVAAMCPCENGETQQVTYPAALVW